MIGLVIVYCFLISVVSFVFGNNLIVCRHYEPMRDDAAPECSRQMIFNEQADCECDKLNSQLVTLQEKVSELEENHTTLGRALHSGHCDDLYEAGISLDGVYSIVVDGNLVDVYCEFQKDGNNWLLFQRRFSGDVDFFRNWKNYQKGFGKKEGEFWLGLDHLHAIVSSAKYMLRVDLEDWDGNIAYAEYSSFLIGDADAKYALVVGGFSGDAGDSLARQNNRQFSTKDRDNDINDIGSCAAAFNGAWWYENCHDSNLNGLYLKGGQVNDSGLIWNSWKGHMSLKKGEMKIRPILNWKVENPGDKAHSPPKVAP